MRRFANAIVVGLLLCATPDPASAQRVVISFAPASSPGGYATHSINLDGGLEWSVPGALSTAPVFTSDGRFVLCQLPLTPTGPLALYARDVVTSAVLSLPADFEPRAAHPRRLEIFGLRDVRSTGFGTSAGTLAWLDPSGVTAGGGCAAGTTVAFDLSVDGRTVAALCESGDVAFVDAESGALIRTLPTASGPPITSLRLNHDSTALLVTRTASSANEVARIDAVSGATLASVTLDPANAACGVAGIAPDRSTAVIGCSFSVPPISIGGTARVLDVATLTLGPSLAGQIPGTAVFSPDGREVFLVTRHRLGFGAVNRHDVSTGAVTLSSGTVYPGQFGVAFAPLPPTLGATVSGQRVDLQWTLPAHSPAASRHVLEIGTAPGLTNLGTMAIGAQSALTVASAPPGRYYVRVRAVNATGTGAPSNELVIDVP